MPIFQKHLSIFSALLLTCITVSPLYAEDNVDEITSIPLESLMNIKVSSVSKKEQTMQDAAAAVFVISQDDIRRSGATSIPELLRMVPGIQVGRIDSNKWAISSRGFNGRFSNKLLVLMDGRSLYTPFFIGIYWEIQDTALEDIDRIEVIRGPGAALWGSNAVNGVINIITKPANSTKGLLVSSGGGTYEKTFTTGRYAARINKTTDLRLYAKYLERGAFVDKNGNDANDSYYMARTGFRLDSNLTSKDSLTIQGDYFSGSLSETYHLYHLPTPQNPNYSSIIPHTSDTSGGNIISSWKRQLSENESVSLKLYYDHSERSMLVAPQNFNTLDIEFQHRLPIATVHDVIWGASYRYNRYKTTNTPTLWFDRTQVTNHQINAFIHDDISLIPDTLFLIMGSRFEQSDAAGFELQPNGRLLWKPTPHQSLWGAVSLATRAKTIGEEDIHYNYSVIQPNTGPNSTSLPLRLEIVGNKNFKSEEVIGYELGYRTEVTPTFSIDAAMFYNRYSNMRVITPTTGYGEPSANSPSNLVQPYYLSNDMHGYSFGGELSADWNPLEWWRLQGSYSFERLIMKLGGTSNDYINKGNAEGDTPRHQLSIRSGVNLSRFMTLDLWLKGVTPLDSIDGMTIPGYVELDARLAWNVSPNLKIILVGQNLIDDHHQEFMPEYINTIPSEVPRSMYGMIVCTY